MNLARTQIVPESFWYSQTIGGAAPGRHLCTGSSRAIRFACPSNEPDNKILNQRRSEFLSAPSLCAQP
jgi:hypothetical protein